MDASLLNFMVEVLPLLVREGRTAICCVAKVVFSGLLQHTLSRSDGYENVLAELVEELLRRGFVQGRWCLLAVRSSICELEELRSMVNYHKVKFISHFKLGELRSRRAILRLSLANSLCILRRLSAAWMRLCV